MPKICFVPKRFTQSHLGVIKRANVLLEKYAAAGIDITLRTLYYQFVKNNWITNEETSYKRLGSIIGEARLAGRIDWDHMEDRMRALESLRHFASPQEALDGVARTYHIDLWEGQEYRPEVWIEKDAQGGILGPICRRYDVPFFCCRGYTSLTEMYHASNRLRHWTKLGYKPFILHFGDHDPSGQDMSRDIEERLRITFDADCEFKRVALNMDQITQYDCPPNPAKVEDSRYKKYVEEYGTSSWEMDALEPFDLQRLCEHEIKHLLDAKKYDARVAERDATVNQLGEVAQGWTELAGLRDERNQLRGDLTRVESSLATARLELNKLRAQLKKKGK